MLARSMAISLGGTFKRLQCTPDLLPNDVTGVSVFNQRTGEFDFRPGPVFVNILLADEINRATPRTQSALLEAMQEGQVTVDGVTRTLPQPFLVLATQNPIEYEGTFPLPEAQLDRFLLRLSIGYPGRADERKILANLRHGHPVHQIKPVADGQDLLLYQDQIGDIYVDDTLQDYILSLVEATRQHPDLALGGSPRASLALFKASQALAAIHGRDHVIPDDIKALVQPTLGHRLIVKPESQLRGKTASTLLDGYRRKHPSRAGTVDQKVEACHNGGILAMKDFLPLLILLMLLAAVVREEAVLTVFYLVGGIYLAGYLWSRVALRNVKFERHFTNRVFLNETVPVRLKIKNQGWLPVIWLQTHESLPVELGISKPLRNALSLASHGSSQIDYQVYAIKRGYYPIGPLFLRSGDFLGLGEDEERVVDSDHLIVYPKIIPLTRIDLPSRSPLGNIKHPQPGFEDPCRLLGKRDYQVGRLPAQDRLEINRIIRKAAGEAVRTHPSRLKLPSFSTWTPGITIIALDMIR